MQDIAVDRIIAIHATIMTRDGGDRRIISEANLHQLIFRANLIPDPIARAALALYSLSAYPVFREGNIRTAQKLAVDILADGGYTLDPDDTQPLRRLAEGVAAFTVEPDEIGSWLAAHAQKHG